LIADDSPSSTCRACSPPRPAASSAGWSGGLERPAALAAAGRDFPSAHVFRRFLQARLAACLTRPPLADPLAAARLPRLARLPEEIERRWPRPTRRCSPRLRPRSPRCRSITR